MCFCYSVLFIITQLLVHMLLIEMFSLPTSAFVVLTNLVLLNLCHSSVQNVAEFVARRRRNYSLLLPPWLQKLGIVFLEISRNLLHCVVESCGDVLS